MIRIVLALIAALLLTAAGSFTLSWSLSSHPNAVGCVQLDWPAVGGAERYRLQYSFRHTLVNDGAWTAGVGGSRSAIDPRVIYDCSLLYNDYMLAQRFRVIALDGDGDVIARSQRVQVEDYAP